MQNMLYGVSVKSGRIYRWNWPSVRFLFLVTRGKRCRLRLRSGILLRPMGFRQSHKCCARWHGRFDPRETAADICLFATYFGRGATLPHRCSDWRFFDKTVMEDAEREEQNLKLFYGSKLAWVTFGGTEWVHTWVVHIAIYATALSLCIRCFKTNGFSCDEEHRHINVVPSHQKPYVLRESIPSLLTMGLIYRGFGSGVGVR
jgi:hypothetical protein